MVPCPGEQGGCLVKAGRHGREGSAYSLSSSSRVHLELHVSPLCMPMIDNHVFVRA